MLHTVAMRADMRCALAIGGLDPGGGAGLCADLRAFAAAGAFGCAAVAVVTVQSTSGLVEATPLPSRQVDLQAREVLERQRVRAIKTGALGSPDNVHAVADLLAVYARLPAVVDPVMAPTRATGRRARLLDERALDAVRTRLVPRATLVTANVPEAEALTGARVRSLTDAHDAAIAITKLGAKMALVKGGHLPVGARGAAQVIDVLALAGEVVELRAKRIDLPSVHGTGCTLASLVAGRIAADRRDFAKAGAKLVLDAIRWAKRVHHRALANAVDVGGEMRVLVP